MATVHQNYSRSSSASTSFAEREDAQVRCVKEGVSAQGEHPPAFGSRDAQIEASLLTDQVEQLKLEVDTKAITEPATIEHTQNGDVPTQFGNDLPKPDDTGPKLINTRNSSSSGASDTKTYNPSTSSDQAASTISAFDGVTLQILDRGASGGKGLFAKTHISPSALVLEEEPLMTIPENYKFLAVAQYQNLSVEQTKKFNELSATVNRIGFENEARMSLPDEIYDLEEDEEDAVIDEAVRIMTIFATNNFGLDNGKYGLFHNISRINHGCIPNVRAWWDPTSGKQSIRAVKTIHPGEELRFSYLGSLATYMMTEERKDRLFDDYGFHCNCSLCHGSAAKTKESDQNRRALRALSTDIRKNLESNPSPHDAYFMERGAATFKQAEEAVDLMMQEELIGHELVVSLQVAAQLELKTQPHQAAEYFAAKFARIAKVYQGESSPEGKKGDDLVEETDGVIKARMTGLTARERELWQRDTEKRYEGKGVVERMMAQLGLEGNPGACV